MGKNEMSRQSSIVSQKSECGTNERFENITAPMPRLFDALAKSEPVLEKGSASLKGKAGVYAFFENGVAVHVGRTLLVRKRR